MRKLAFILLAILTIIPCQASARQQVEFIKALRSGPISFLEVDDKEGLIYATQSQKGIVMVMDFEGRVVSVMGQQLREGQPVLKEPVGIALYEDKVYVTDRARGRVVIFTKDGGFVDSFGHHGSNRKEFDEPGGLFVLGDVIYVADTGNGRVQMFGPNGVYLGSIGKKGEGLAKLDEPTDVTVGLDGFVTIVDRGDRHVKKYLRTGGYNGNLIILRNPYAIASSMEGFFIADTEVGVQMADLKGNRKGSIGSYGSRVEQFASLRGIAAGEDGVIYVSDPGKADIKLFRIEKTATGKPEKMPPPPTAIKWMGDIGLAADRTLWDGNDTLYVLNSKEKSIRVIKDRKLVNTIAARDWKPVGMDVDPEGYLWVVDQTGDRIVKVGANGNILQSVGSGGSGEGYFKNPTDVAISNKGFIYVADKGNKRVQVFSRDGIFINIVGRGGTSALIKSPISIDVDSQGILYVLDDDEYEVSAYSPDGLLLKKFGREGDGEGEFDEPVGLSVTDNEVFVLDAGVNNVKVFSRKGVYLREFGAKGSGKGDFDEPVSIAKMGDLVLLVCDPRNKRVQVLGLIYTPDTPRMLVAQDGRLSVKLAWKKETDTFIEKYLVYRSVNPSRGFEPIGESRDSSFTDTNVRPGMSYYYRVSAVAKDGNEGPPSLTEKATPFK